MKIVVYTFFCLFITEQSFGLNCLKCTNARTHAACDQTGILERCSGDNIMCKTEIRSISTSRRQLISKGCKQARACRNNMNLRSCQNGPPPPNGVCYCCCSNDRCNRGSRSCRFNRRTANRRDYRPGFCIPPLTSIRNGNVRCSDTNREGSVCYFRCLRSHVITEGRSTVKCRRNGLWSGNPPTCEPVKCRPLYAVIKHGRASCSRRNNFNSKCSFKCRNGYVMKGKYSSTCLLDRKNSSRGKWTNQLPVCIKTAAPLRCGLLQAPDNGGLECRNGDRIGSVCKFSCKSGYNLSGTKTTTCSLNKPKKPHWTFPTSFCKAAPKCPGIPKDSFRMVECSDDKFNGSTCTFLCHPTQRMIRQSLVTCTQRNNTLTWEPELPVCVAKTCLELGKLSNGLMTCDRGNALNSRCVFSCLERYHLIGRDEITCNQLHLDHALWDGGPPVCQPMCEAISPLEHGHVECLEGHHIGASCSFNCDDDFKLTGSHIMTCVEEGNDAVWMGKSPVCKKICGEIKRFRFGVMVCSNENFLGSTCRFVCNSGYKLVGATETSCIDERDRGTRWGSGIPECKEYCPVLDDLKDGTVVCSDKHFLGSTCHFSCGAGFDLSGSPTTSCVYDLLRGITWSSSTPTCKKLLCNDLSPMEHGAWECSSQFEYQSTCDFSCEPKYTLHPFMTTTVTCLADQSWSRSQPCCAAPCSDNPYMDLLFALDSSSSVGDDSWDLMVGLVQRITSFYDIADNGTCIAAFRYNRKVDEESTIPFNFAKSRGRKALIDQIGKIPYDGRGTKTGQALKYAAKEMFQERNGDRPGAKNVLIILTDGTSQDNVQEQTDMLRNQGVLIFAVAVNTTKGELDRDQLEYIAGHDHNLFILDKGFSSLTAGFARDITQSVCHDPCHD